jgi:mannosyltransferase OCH1-like enzyme
MNTNQDLLGIILPVYNPPMDLFESCIASIKANKWQNFEVIMTMDFFSEELRSKLIEISNNDSRFKLFQNKDNAGSYYNYYHTMKNLSNNVKWVTILDCDDRIEEDFYYDLITQCQEEGADAIRGNQNHFNYRTKNIITRENDPKGCSIDSNPWIIKCIFSRDLINRCSDLTLLNTFLYYGTDEVIGAYIINNAKKIITQKTNSAYIYTTFNETQSVNAFTKPLFMLQIRLLTTMKSIQFLKGKADFKGDIQYIKETYKFNKLLSETDKAMLYNFIDNNEHTTYVDNTIPKIIHWCWISDNPVPPEVEKNIFSWRKHNPDWLIIKWDDSYFKNNPYVQSAIKAKKYATAADYIRLWALYNFGGIYLDSDCECFKSFDDIIKTDFLLGYEAGNYIAGHFIGSALANLVIKETLDWYDNKIFDLSWLQQGPEPIQKGMPYTLPGLMTNLLKHRLLKIYPEDYFTAKNYGSGQINKTENTYILHHYAASWLKETKEQTFQLSNFGFNT